MIKYCFLFALTFMWFSCKENDNNPQIEFIPLTSSEADMLITELEFRSFRQFDPGRNQEPRKGIILDFFKQPDGIIMEIWAQYADNNIALNEWELSTTKVNIYKAEGEIYKIEFADISSRIFLPEVCDNCLELNSYNLFVRDPFSDTPQFKLEQHSNLPLPFPVFSAWTTFDEDIFID